MAAEEGLLFLWDGCVGEVVVREGIVFTGIVSIKFSRGPGTITRTQLVRLL